MTVKIKIKSIEFTCKQCGLTYESLPRNMRKNNKDGICDICYERSKQKEEGTILKWI
ncbi:hypothetical protein LCGC14_0224160 [marine sediment metagenome]|uniref:Uncharacterized protein n=1 Tax=marine sediment metagenome TaxID=412755 RepID=A0A0F9XG23_9ZZZZ